MQVLKTIQGIGVDAFGYNLGSAAILVVAITAVLVVSFAVHFSLRAFMLARGLRQATSALHAVDGNLGGQIDQEIGRVLSRTAVIGPYWAEYRASEEGGKDLSCSPFASDGLITDSLRLDIFRYFPVLMVAVAVAGLALELFLGAAGGDSAVLLAAGTRAESFAVTTAVSMSGLLAAIAVAAIQHAQVKQCRRRLRRMARALDSLADRCMARREPGPTPGRADAPDTNDALVGEINRLLVELGGEPAAAPPVTSSRRQEVPDDVAREMRALLREMRSGFTQSLFELAEANRAMREQLVRLMEETEVRQRRLLDALEGMAAGSTGEGGPRREDGGPAER